MTNLDKKILDTEEIVRKAKDMFAKDKAVVTWKGAKDSTVLLHIIRTIYKGKIPFPIFFNDSTMEFPEVYEFIKKMTNLWRLKLAIVRHDESMLSEFNKTKDQSKKEELSRIMKIKSLTDFQQKNGIEAYMVGIRRDENPARANETYFSARKTHMRIHPILDFTETDIWEYIHRYNVPYCSLYDQGYRSLGEKPFTKKATKGGSERSGRDTRKEALMEKLRGMGYW